MSPAITWVAVSAEALLLALGHLMTGLNYYRAGRPHEAAHEFQVILERHADSPVADDALYWAARALDDAGHTNEAHRLRARLMEQFPHSPYCTEFGPVAAGAAAPVAPAAEPIAGAARPQPPLASDTPAAPVPQVDTLPPARLVVRNVRGFTVVQLDGRDHHSVETLRAALIERQQRQRGWELVFHREPDVDLQMVIDVINLLDELGVRYRIEP